MTPIDHDDHGATSVSPRTAPSDTPSAPGHRVWWAVGIAFVAIVGLLAAFSGSATDSDVEPTALDEFEFATPTGETVTLADFEGPLVVNYFAAWCGPCRAELPDFETVHRELGEEVTFVGVSRDTVTDAWLNLVEDTGVTFPTVFEGSVEGSFVFIDGRAMPTTVFITADGTVAEIWGGPLDDDKLRELIAEHLT